MMALKLQNITYSYEEDKILDKLNLEVKKGDNICICASNNQGKTTLTKLFANKLKYLGSYYINDVEVVKSNAYIVDRFVKTISYGEKVDNYKVVDLLFDIFKYFEDTMQTK